MMRYTHHGIKVIIQAPAVYQIKSGIVTTHESEKEFIYSVKISVRGRTIKTAAANPNNFLALKYITKKYTNGTAYSRVIFITSSAIPA